MFCFPWRKKGWKGDPPESMDQRIFPEHSPGGARPRQLDPEEFSRLYLHQRPRKGWAGLRSQDGFHPSRGSRESWRDTGIPGQAGDGPGCAQVDGKEPGSRQNARAQQEKVKGENTPSESQTLRKDFRGEPSVPRQAQNGNVPREGMEEPQPLLQAGSSEDEEGESSGSSQSQDRDTDAATGQDLEPPWAVGMPRAEPRRWLWEKLRQLGEAMEQWEGKSTAALAAQLAQRITETPTPSYPMEPGICSIRQELGSRASPDLGAPVRNDGIFMGMLRVSGNAESREGDEDSEHSDWDRDWDWEQEQEQEPAVVAVLCLRQSRVSRALQEEFPEVWARSAVDCGRLAEEELLDGDPVPFQHQRRLAPDVERQMEGLLQEYLREGIVVEGTSRSNNPLILRRKPKGRGWRLGLDGRALNAATPAGSRERPDRAVILASIHPRSRFFSVLDFCSACLAIPLARSCWPRFAFTFRGRQFLFTRLPPGFRDTNSILHHRVAAMLDQLEPEPGAAPGIFHYYDDILITGKSWRQAESRTRRVLELIQSTGFKVNWDKAQLVQRRVNYLGITLGAEGRSVPKEKVWEIHRECNAPGPWDPRRLHSVLKKFESRQEFIPDFWELALPLHRLAQPGRREQEREWEWQWEQQEQLRQLREALKATPLRFPLRSRPFLIQLWVHTETVGAALLQEKAGTLLPVGYHSHRLSGRDLSPWDAWCQAAVRAVRAFQILTGPAPIVIQDLNGNYLLRGQAFVTGGSSSSQLTEPWTLLVAIKGPEPWESQRIVIPPAPLLGQLPPDIPRANVWFLAVEKGLFPCTSVGFAATSLEGRGMHGVSGKGVVEDAELEALREILEQHRSRFPLFLYCNCPGLVARLEMREREQGWNSCGNTWPRVLRWLRTFPGMLCIREVGTAGNVEPLEREQIKKVADSARALGCITRSSWILWEPSKSERQEIVAWCHQSRHEGVEQSLARVRAVEHWSSSQEDVTRWVRSCPTCRESDPDADPDPAPQRAEGPWSCLRISLSGALPSTPEGFGALLVVQDELSGWLDAFPLQQRAQADVSQTLLREVFRRFGKVRSVLLAPAPAWMRRSLEEAPLRNFWSRLECSELPVAAAAAAASVSKAAQAAGEGWARMLPLILAGVRSQWIEAEKLHPLLCVPGLPLELHWEWSSHDPSCGNELSRVRGMQLLPGYREQVEAALRTDPGSGAGIGIRGFRDLGTPDPGSEYARAAVRHRWIRDWIQSDHGLGGAGSGIGTGWTQAPP
uniref:ribonuclease H n=1 Tax=Cyanoderma ruficeps TaxID=181631 RepID=A0A8C3RDN5_9PASS